MVNLVVEAKKLTKEAQQEFLRAELDIYLCMIAIDGVIENDEITMVMQHAEVVLADKEIRDKIINEAVNDFTNNTSHSLDRMKEACSIIKNSYPDFAENVMWQAGAIAESDGEIERQELDLLYIIGVNLGLSKDKIMEHIKDSTEMANILKSNKEKTTQQPNSSKSGCYVATCVYGSYDCPEVWTLRRFRDDTLGSTWYGRLFIKTYYTISPTLVKWFGETKWFKNMWKPTLDNMVEKLQSKGVKNTPYVDKMWR